MFFKDFESKPMKLLRTEKIPPHLFSSSAGWRREEFLEVWLQTDLPTGSAKRIRDSSVRYILLPLRWGRKKEGVVFGC